MTETFMINAEGHHVPLEKVRPEDRLEDDIVRELHGQALALQAEIRTFKAQAFDTVAAFLSLLAEKYGTSRGGKKGNITLTSYDGLSRVQVAVQDYIQFGPQLQIAKQLVDECLHEWSDGANANLKAIVDQAFRVDKNNRLNTQAILGLRRLHISDEKWVKAMEAITDSIRVTSSKQYIRFYRRPAPEADFEAVNLDIAKL